MRLDYHGNIFNIKGIGDAGYDEYPARGVDKNGRSYMEWQNMQNIQAIIKRWMPISI